MNLKILESLGSKLIGISPTIASLITDPIPEIGKLVLKLVANEFGADPQNPQDIIDKLTIDANKDVKLKEIEESVLKLGMSLSASDTEGARSQELSQEKLGINDYMPKVVTMFLIISFVAIFVLIFTKTLNPANSTLLGSMIGMLTREFMQACRYYIGGDDSKS